MKAIDVYLVVLEVLKERNITIKLETSLKLAEELKKLEDKDGSK